MPYFGWWCCVCLARGAFHCLQHGYSPSMMLFWRATMCVLYHTPRQGISAASNKCHATGWCCAWMHSQTNSRCTRGCFEMVVCVVGCKGVLHEFTFKVYEHIVAAAAAADCSAKSCDWLVKGQSTVSLTVPGWQPGMCCLINLINRNMLNMFLFGPNGQPVWTISGAGCLLVAANCRPGRMQSRLCSLRDLQPQHASAHECI